MVQCNFVLLSSFFFHFPKNASSKHKQKASDRNDRVDYFNSVYVFGKVEIESKDFIRIFCFCCFSRLSIKHLFEFRINNKQKQKMTAKIKVKIVVVVVVFCEQVTFVQNKNKKHLMKMT